MTDEMPYTPETLATRSDTMIHPMYGITKATQLCGIGKTKLYAEINAGRLRAKRFGNKFLIDGQAIQDWKDSLPDAK